MSQAAATRLAVGALTAAADEDRATGGVDLERRIFPIVKHCSSTGVEDCGEEEIEGAYRDTLALRTNGGSSE
jgi:20S proteasome alpha/beta subunit